MTCLMSGRDHFQTHTMLRDAGHPWYTRLHQLTQTGTPMKEVIDCGLPALAQPFSWAFKAACCGR